MKAAKGENGYRGTFKRLTSVCFRRSLNSIYVRSITDIRPELIF